VVCKLASRGMSLRVLAHPCMSLGGKSEVHIMVDIDVEIIQIRTHLPLHHKREVCFQVRRIGCSKHHVQRSCGEQPNTNRRDIEITQWFILERLWVTTSQSTDIKENKDVQREGWESDAVMDNTSVEHGTPFSINPVPSNLKLTSISFLWIRWTSPRHSRQGLCSPIQVLLQVTYSLCIQWSTQQSIENMGFERFAIAVFLEQLARV